MIFLLPKFAARDFYSSLKVGVLIVNVNRQSVFILNNDVDGVPATNESVHFISLSIEMRVKSDTSQHGVQPTLINALPLFLTGLSDPQFLVKPECYFTRLTFQSIQAVGISSSELPKERQ